MTTQIEAIIEGLNMDGLLPANKKDQQLARQILEVELKPSKSVEELIEKRKDQSIEPDYCQPLGSYLCDLFIQDLQSLQEPTEQQGADVEEIKGCPKCGNKIKRDYDDEYCCECGAKL